jgi:hypothetical protein
LRSTHRTHKKYLKTNPQLNKNSRHDTRSQVLNQEKNKKYISMTYRQSPPKIIASKYFYCISILPEQMAIFAAQIPILPENLKPNRRTQLNQVNTGKNTD